MQYEVCKNNNGKNTVDKKKVKKILLSQRYKFAR